MVVDLGTLFGGRQKSSKSAELHFSYSPTVDNSVSEMLGQYVNGIAKNSFSLF